MIDHIAIASSCKFYKAAETATKTLLIHGFNVHAPNFKYDETQVDVSMAEKRMLTTRFLKGMRECGALYVVSTDGYVGRSVSMEIGYAHALGMPIWFSEFPVESAFSAVMHGAGNLDRFVWWLESQ